MIWDICLAASLLLFIALVVVGFVVRKIPTRPKLFSLLNVILAATAISAYLLVLPIQHTTGCGLAEGLIITVQHMLQVFSLDGDFGALREIIQCSTPLLQSVYYIFAAFLYVLAPVLTVGVVLSFFQDATNHLRLQGYRWRTLYVFSELNESALVLARSCIDHEKAQGKKAAVIFTDVFERNEETSFEMRDQAERMGALCFKKDILALRLPQTAGEVYFFIIGEDDAENIDHATHLIARHGQNEKASLYIFTASTESTLLLGSVVSEDMRMKVRRVNLAQSLVYNYLYTHNIFENAIDLPNGEKLLRVVIVGMGRYGTEFLKAITWAGQVPGYQLDIHVFDQDATAEERFSSMCPELMDMNGNDIDGEAHYNITFHRTGDGKGIGVYTRTFDRHIADLGDVCLAIVALGSDAADIEVSMKMRTLLRRSTKGFTPTIEAIVYQSVKPQTIQTYTLYDQKGNDAMIHFIGDLRETFSYDFVLRSTLEQEAERRHLKWCSKVEQIPAERLRFYRFEYFYRSSIASAIRYKIRLRMSVPGIEKKPEERTIDERIAIQRMEHAGWNAYMRSEGYCCGPRDDLAKRHHLLIPFDELPYEEQIKDDD